jgi:hypothetical protein
MAERRRAGRPTTTNEGVDPIAGAHPQQRPRGLGDGADDVAPPVSPAELDRRDGRQSRRRKAPGPDKGGPPPQPRRRGGDESPPSDPALPDPE